MKAEQYFFYLLHSIELGKDVPQWLRDEAKKYKQEYFEEKLVPIIRYYDGPWTEDGFYEELEEEE